MAPLFSIVMERAFTFSNQTSQEGMVAGEEDSRTSSAAGLFSPGSTLTWNGRTATSTSSETSCNETKSPSNRSMPNLDFNSTFFPNDSNIEAYQDTTIIDDSQNTEEKANDDFKDLMQRMSNSSPMTRARLTSLFTSSGIETKAAPIQVHFSYDELTDRFEQRNDDDIPYNTPEGLTFGNHGTTSAATIATYAPFIYDQKQQTLEANMKLVHDGHFIPKGSSTFSDPSTFGDDFRNSNTLDQQNLGTSLQHRQEIVIMVAEEQVSTSEIYNEEIVKPINNISEQNTSTKNASYQNSPPAGETSNNAMKNPDDTPSSQQGVGFSSSTPDLQTRKDRSTDAVDSPTLSPINPMNKSSKKSTSQHGNNFLGNFQILPGVVTDGSSTLFKATNIKTKEVFIVNSKQLSIFQGSDFEIGILPGGIEANELSTVTSSKTQPLGKFSNDSTQSNILGEFSNSNLVNRKQFLGEFSNSNLENRKQSAMQHTNTLDASNKHLNFQNIAQKASKERLTNIKSTERTANTTHVSNFDLDNSIPTNNASFRYDMEFDKPVSYGKRRFGDLILREEAHLEEEPEPPKKEKKNMSMRNAVPRINKTLTVAFYDRPENLWIDRSIEVLSKPEFAKSYFNLGLENVKAPHWFVTMSPLDSSDRKGFAIQTPEGLVVSRTLAYKYPYTVTAAEIEDEEETDCCLICGGLFAMDYCIVMSCYLVRDSDGPAERVLYGKSMAPSCYWHFRTTDAFFHENNPLFADRDEKKPFYRGGRGGRGGRGRGRSDRAGRGRGRGARNKPVTQDYGV